MKTIINITVWGLLTFLHINGFSQVDNRLNEKFVIVLDIEEPFTKDVLEDAPAHNLIRNINVVIDKSNPENVIYIKKITKLFCTFECIFDEKSRT